MVTSTAFLALADERLNRSVGYRSINLQPHSRIRTVHARSTDTHKAIQSMLREFCMVSPDQNHAAIAGAQ
ncbi:hypothetical protein [Treponema sp. R80B11-R83G3]